MAKYETEHSVKISNVKIYLDTVYTVCIANYDIASLKLFVKSCIYLSAN